MGIQDQARSGWSTSTLQGSACRERLRTTLRHQLQ
ncbi:hypothetical protein PhCBS80983_g01656 [Powellomyces hirtus]|uniref:Uncharacterized protein n=1 Tax=Powellomyces hirtus TaxID=109895 RepID=A0A507EAZ5_9FUNG|nr:hypothetical protein PhCBS80983_g01656 [Powellomyces hirtus]